MGSKDTISWLSEAEQTWKVTPRPSQGGVTLIIVAIGGETQRISLKEPRTLMVGRASDNDVRLDDNSVSDSHVQIAYDGHSLLLTDMYSTNGTFLGDTRLLPGVCQPWPLGMALRLGTYWAKFELQAAAEPSVTGPPMPSRALAWPTVALEPKTLTVEAGQQVAARLRVLNQGTQVHHFTVSIDGIPGSWVTLPRGPVRLNPNDEGQVMLILHPPRDPQSTAGAHPFSLRIVPRASSGWYVEPLGTVSVIPFYEIAAELRPRQIQTSHAHLELVNRGNTSAILSISGIDPALTLFIQAHPAQVTLQPGEQRIICLEVRPQKRRPLLGRIQRHPFELSISSSVGESLKCGGTRVVRPIIPIWVLPPT